MEWGAAADQETEQNVFGSTDKTVPIGIANRFLCIGSERERGTPVSGGQSLGNGSSWQGSRANLSNGRPFSMLAPVPIENIAAPVSVPVVGCEAPLSELRVLHVVNGEHFAGAERVQSHLGRCLPRLGVQGDFAMVKPGKFAQVLREQDGIWGEGFAIRMNSPFDLRPAWQLRDLIHERRYDLLHAHTPRTAVIASIASRLTGVPWIYHVHNPALRDSPSKCSNQINAWIEKVSLHGCSHMIAVSESLRLDCIAGGAAEHDVSVVHNGVPAIRHQREWIPAPEGTWTLGMVALMRPRKGLEVVLEALTLLAAEDRDVSLQCTGPFETEQYEKEIKERIDALGIGERVELRGFTNNVPRTLAKVDALVHPSLFGEGLPMVVLEAMAAGLPVVATRVEGTPEAITDGVEGLLAEPRDPVSLADSIRSLIRGDHDWSQMAERAHQRHLKCFSDEAMARGTAEVYRKVVHGGPNV